MTAIKRILKEMLRPAILAIGIQSGAVILSAAPNFIVVRTLSLSDVTKFSICYQLASLPLVAIAAIVPVFWPAFTIMWQAGERKRLRRWMIIICSGTAGLLLLFAAGMGALGPWLVRLWTHGAINPPGLFLMILCASVLIQGVLNWLSTFMWSLSELWIQLITQAAGAVMLIVLGFLLGRLWGIYGIAVAMVIAITIGEFFPMWWRTLKLFNGSAEPSSGMMPNQEIMTVSNI